MGLTCTLPPASANPSVEQRTMAFLSVNFKGKELGKWPLNGPVTLGRSNECNIMVRDILLSRRHCQIVPYRNGWIAIDLGSKNGTRSAGVAITRRGLVDGETLMMGKTVVRFHMGRLPGEHRTPPRRPADPFEALSATVSAFDPTATDVFCREHNMPRPRPQPKAPASFERDGVQSLVNEIVSSSWDSIYQQASLPKRPLPCLTGPSAIAAITRRADASPVTLPSAAAVLTRSRLAFADELQVRPPRPARPQIATPSCSAAVLQHPYQRMLQSAADVLRAMLFPMLTLQRWMQCRYRR